ncbi:MAG: hypothetical protein WAV11_03080 [Minisyncoccia bacterium]
MKYLPHIISAVYLTMIGFIVFGPIASLAQDDPAVVTGGKTSLLALGKVPGLSGISDGGVDLPSFLNSVFKLLIGVALTAAVVRIFYGGFQYATTESIFGKTEAAKTIKNALYGLLLVLGAWLVLYTINPQLVSLNLFK